MSLAAGGPPVVAANISRALDSVGIGTSIFTTTAFHSDQRDGQIDDMPTGLSGTEVQAHPIQTFKRLAYSPLLNEALRSRIREYDVVHIHSLFQYPQFAAFQNAWRYSVPYVVSPHGALDPYLRTRGRVRKWLVDRMWQRKMLDNADALHFTTVEEAKLVKDLNFKSPPVIIPNGVDVRAFGTQPQHYEVQPIKAELGIGTGPIIANHGRLDHKKGLAILIQAMPRILSHFPSAQLVLIGPDSRGHRKFLERQVADHHLEQVVLFAGLRRGAELTNLIHAADIWALPSFTENFGYAVVEAMAAGKPVVTSPHVNIASEAHEAGALIMVDNKPDLFANAIVDQLRDREAGKDLGERARVYAGQFDWSVVGQQYVDLYVSIAAGRGGSRQK